MNRTVFRLASACCALMLATEVVVGGTPNTFFYTGPSGGDFFDEANWTTNADGTGSSPLNADDIEDSASNAITLDLIIDGDTVVADGQVDFGTGSLTMQSGSSLSITAPGADLDINSDSTFNFTDSTLVVDDIINFEGTSIFSGGSVTSVTDDIAFQNNFVNLTIDGTMFLSADTTYFDGPTPGSITNATFTIVDQFGLRDDGSGPANVVMTDSHIDVQANGGTSGGDIQDIFDSASTVKGSSLTLLGASTLRADAIETGVDLFLGGTSEATLGVIFEERIVDAGSTITFLSTDAVLNVVQLDPNPPNEYVDARPFLINGFTGATYESNPEQWNVTDWDGVAAVSLQVVFVPEPSSMLLGLACFAVMAVRANRDR